MRHTLQRSVRALAITLVTTAMFGGCLPLPGGRYMGSRVISGKSGEDTLIADGGYTCRVTSPDFERLRVGDAHRCVWSPPSGSEGPKVGDPRKIGKQGPAQRTKPPQ